MCTVSWAIQPGGYLLLFNRDELKTRKPAAGPVGKTYSGVHTIAPVDGDQGGTWLLVNEFGLTLGLLNHYPPGAGDEGGGRPSRGGLIPACADLGRTDQVVERLQAMDLGRYAPFRLLVCDRHGGALLTWDGTGLELTKGEGLAPPLTSSSFRPEEVSAYRMRQFEGLMPKGQISAGALEACHHHHDPSMPAHSVMMFRPDACTHSFCRIDVDTTEARLRYEPQTWIRQEAGPSESRLTLRR